MRYDDTCGGTAIEYGFLAALVGVALATTIMVGGKEQPTDNKPAILSTK